MILTNNSEKKGQKIYLQNRELEDDSYLECN